MIAKPLVRSMPAYQGVNRDKVSKDEHPLEPRGMLADDRAYCDKIKVKVYILIKDIIAFRVSVEIASQDTFPHTTWNRYEKIFLSRKTVCIVL